MLGPCDRLVHPKSPSSRRAWIEIVSLGRCSRPLCVALLAEGVDRNVDDRQGDRQYYVALLAEGVDRNKLQMIEVDELDTSPSSRRAWIEIASS